MLKEHHKIVTAGLKLSDMAVLAIAMPVAPCTRGSTISAAVVA